MTLTAAAVPAAEAGASSPAAARLRYRDGLAVPTTGWASGYAQANLVALPRDWAFDMLLFAQRNPQAVPLLDVTDPGSTSTALAPGADLRTDLPRYRVWRDGELVDEPTDVVDLWREDLVTFVIGCSFTFEAALLDAGVPVRNVEQGRNVAMYRTDVPCRPAGRLSGPLVVSMRPVPASQVVTAVQVTGRMPQVHGAPVHVGAPDQLGDHRPRAAGLRRRPGPARGRRPGVLGLRGHTAGGPHGLAPPVRDQPRTGPHAPHRRSRRGVPAGVTRAGGELRAQPGTWICR